MHTKYHFSFYPFELDILFSYILIFLFNLKIQSLIHPSLIVILIIKRPRQKKMDMRFGTWNVRSVYRAASLRAVAEEISKYKLDFVGVQEVTWDTCGTEPAGKNTFICGKENENHELGFFPPLHKRIISAVNPSIPYTVPDTRGI
jgi:hypothetical protein